MKPSNNGLTELWIPGVVFTLIAALIVWDIAADLAVGTTVAHVVIELLMMLAALVGAFHSWNRLRAALLFQRKLERDLKKLAAENIRWHEEQEELLRNLRLAIEKQFELWDFSPTEKEVALYLLKGLSLKEIAKLRSSTFQSVRQQAHLLYGKAGLGSRAELSAFFLGGLLQPLPESHSVPGQSSPGFSKPS